MDNSPEAAPKDAASVLLLSVRYEFADPADDLPPGPFLEVERFAPAALSMLALEAALRQWRLAVEFAVALSEEQTLQSYAKAVDERSRRTAADQALRHSHGRRVEPPHYPGLRVLHTHLDGPWELTLDLGPAFSPTTDATRLLFFFVERAFGLALDVAVRDGALRHQLESLHEAAGQLPTDHLAHAVSREIAAAAGGHESNDALDAAIDEIRHQLPYEASPAYTGELDFAPVKAALTDFTTD
jgi:hypothetical protein